MSAFTSHSNKSLHEICNFATMYVFLLRVFTFIRTLENHSELTYFFLPYLTIVQPLSSHGPKMERNWTRPTWRWRTTTSYCRSPRPLLRTLVNTRALPQTRLDTWNTPSLSGSKVSQSSTSLHHTNTQILGHVQHIYSHKDFDLNFTLHCLISRGRK